jgi:hypothetical protein
MTVSMTERDDEALLEQSVFCMTGHVGAIPVAATAPAPKTRSRLVNFMILFPIGLDLHHGERDRDSDTGEKDGGQTYFVAAVYVRHGQTCERREKQANANDQKEDLHREGTMR